MRAWMKLAIVAVLTWEARLALRRHKPRIIAVTGSMGKTTTKDAIFASLSIKQYVRKSAKSYNSDIGVPLAILGLPNGGWNPFAWVVNIIRGLWVAVGERQYPDWLVLEVGADRPGDIRSIARWLKPDVAVITGVPDIPVHVEYFASPEEVLKEKWSLSEYLTPGGTLVLNGDDARMRRVAQEFQGTRIFYGVGEENEFCASHDVIMYEEGMPSGMQFRLNARQYSMPISVPGALGIPRVYAALAALAVAQSVGVEPLDAARGLSTWEPPPGRMRIISGQRDTVLIDDSYNSSPAAALAALDTLKAVQAKRRIAVMGDMLELGKYSAEAHRQVGERAAQCADMLITVGFRSRIIAEAARDSGMEDMHIRQYEIDEANRAGKELARELEAGDVILLKGSRRIRMEEAVRELMKDPAHADDLLVRTERGLQ